MNARPVILDKYQQFSNVNNSLDNSLTEIDVEVGRMFLRQMQKADPRTVTTKTDQKLWDADRIVQVDELEIQEIRRAYLIANSKKDIDITWPILGYCAQDIDEVFYGTGNRVKQWEFFTDAKDEDWAVNDLVWITAGFFRGLSGTIKEINLSERKILVDVETQNEQWIDIVNLRPSGEKAPSKFHAKQIITDYDAVFLCDNKKEARYFMNNYLLRLSTTEIFHTYTSNIVPGAEFALFTIFGIPNLKSYPKSDDKLKGEGYIYGVSFNVKVWTYIADAPVPSHIIEQIRLSIKVEAERLVNRIVVS